MARHWLTLLPSSLVDSSTKDILQECGKGNAQLECAVVQWKLAYAESVCREPALTDVALLLPPGLNIGLL
jgi:hypothetical protein